MKHPRPWTVQIVDGRAKLVDANGYLVFSNSNYEDGATDPETAEMIVRLVNEEHSWRAMVKIPGTRYQGEGIPLIEDDDSDRVVTLTKSQVNWLLAHTKHKDNESEGHNPCSKDNCAKCFLADLIK